MQLTHSEEQLHFQDMVARFLEASSPPTEVRRLMATESGYDPEVWRRLSSELGLTGIHIPETWGGSGFGPIELGIATEQMGRYLYCGPFFASSVMATYALLQMASDEAKTALLPGLAAGETLGCLVLDDLNDPAKVGSSLAADASGHLQGTAPLVVDANNADLMLVVARETGGLGLYLLDLLEIQDTPANGLRITPRQAIDETRKLCRVSFDHTPAVRIGDVTRQGLNRLWDHIIVALAHEMIGGAQRIFDSTIEYTRLRYQFGRPIGSFQGLKHRCADLLVQLEFARSVTFHAADCLAAGNEVAHEPAMAKAMASDLYIEVARTAIQLRGGIGFTWEDDTHLWFKRAKSSEVFMGSPHLHRERMMTMLEAIS